MINHVYSKDDLTRLNIFDRTFTLPVTLASYFVLQKRKKKKNCFAKKIWKRKVINKQDVTITARNIE